MSADRKKFYVTTPIYYVNARPHIGHAYTTIVADVLARRHRLLGDDTFFLTGTDEHGQKIERSAAAAGIPPQQFADEVSASFRALWKRMGMLDLPESDPLFHRRYIRTTDPKHAAGVQKLFSELYARGFIELRNYTGAYCVSDETFVDAPAGTPCPDCGRLLEIVTEENFFFKLSAFQRPLINLIETDVLKVEPESRKNEVLSFLRGNVAAATDITSDTGFQADEKNISEADNNKLVILSEAKDLLSSESAQNPGNLREYSDLGNAYVPGALKDLSISRSSFTWGIPVPEPAASAAKQKHVIYVWLDALANYMTAVGYGSDKPVDQAEFAKFWPADLHLVGKEIIRFHCVYWPAFLLAANLPLPKAITAHGWLLFDNSKMSKSKGNIVRTETILDAFGDEVYGKQFPDSTKAERDLFAADVLRYFLLREIPFGQDGSFSFDALITRYNADLANGYGNLVSRVVAMIKKSFDGAVPTPTPDTISESLLEILEQLEDPGRSYDPASTRIFAIEMLDVLIKLLDDGRLDAALRAFQIVIATVDQMLTLVAPWKLDLSAASGNAAASTTLYTALETIRIYTAVIASVLPFATARVWAQLGLGDIEAAARNGELTNLQWGGLKPGTKLGPLASIFPRADKGLAQIMTDMENPEASTLKSSELKAPEDPRTSFDPAAPPRTSSFNSLDEPSGTLSVGGSGATTTRTGLTPSHTEVSPSGAFASVASQTPMNAAASDASTQITIDDFAKVELRVAQIVVAERIPKADKLLRLEVDLGYEKRQILSGIAEWYAPEDLVGRRIVVITNLAPRKMRGLESHGMLLAASEEGGKPVLATFGEDIALGSRLK